MAPRPAVMERLGHQLLARAAFTGNEHGGLIVLQVFYQGIDLLHLRLLSYDMKELPALIQILPESGQARYISDYQDSAGGFASALQERRGGEGDHLRRIIRMVALKTFNLDQLLFSDHPLKHFKALSIE